MLEIKQLDVRLGQNQWLYNVTLNENATYALLGRSGSGKSTLLNAIAGFIKPVSGALDWNGKPLLALSPDQRPITTLFQQHNLFPHLTVAENIGLGISPALKLNASQRHSIDAVLEAAGLPGYQRKRPPSLSGGEQQRVALARCLLRRQPILLLDEPFSALDPETRQTMTDLLIRVIDDIKPCVLVVTHDVRDADALGASRLQLSDGGITQSDR